MKNALNKFSELIKVAISSYILVVIGQTTFSTIFRVFGVLGHDRFRGIGYMSWIERTTRTIWLDAIESSTLANFVMPMIVVAFLVVPFDRRVVRFLCWMVAILIGYQLMVPGGWPELMSRKHGVFAFLALNGVVCGLAFESFDRSIWKSIRLLHRTRLFEGAA